MSGGEPQEETEQEQQEEEEPWWSELCAAPPPEWVGERVMPLLRSLRGYACLAHMRPAFTYDPGGEHLRRTNTRGGEHYSYSDREWMAHLFQGEPPKRGPRTIEFLSPVLQKLGGTMEGGQEFVLDCSMASTKQLIEEGDGIPPDLLSAVHVLLLLAHLQQTLPNGAYFEVLEAI
eukprot:COSAG01_NODE_26494_length_712_cov_1.182708_1_plen_174_part_10